MEKKSNIVEKKLNTSIGLVAEMDEGDIASKIENSSEKGVRENVRKCELWWNVQCSGTGQKVQFENGGA